MMESKAQSVYATGNWTVTVARFGRGLWMVTSICIMLISGLTLMVLMLFVSALTLLSK
jgi:hypothetical protein